MKSGSLLAKLEELPGIRFCPLYSSIPGGGGAQVCKGLPASYRLPVCPAQE